VAACSSPGLASREQTSHWRPDPAPLSVRDPQRQGPARAAATKLNSFVIAPPEPSIRALPSSRGRGRFAAPLDPLVIRLRRAAREEASLAHIDDHRRSPGRVQCRRLCCPGIGSPSQPGSSRDGCRRPGQHHRHSLAPDPPHASRGTSLHASALPPPQVAARRLLPATPSEARPRRTPLPGLSFAIWGRGSALGGSRSCPPTASSRWPGRTRCPGHSSRSRSPPRNHTICEVW
jgi:hypothetical protein